MTGPSDKSSSPSKKNGGQTAPPINQEDWLDRLAQFWFKIERFVWDVLGALLLALAVILLLGLVGLTKGSMLTPLIDLVNHGFGWGGVLVVAFVAAMGLFALRRRKQQNSVFPLGRLLILETWGFSLLALLAIFGGRTIDLAENGSGGGLVGWGIVELASKLIPAPFLIVLFSLIFIVCALVGFGLIEYITRWIDTWLATQDEPLEEMPPFPAQPAAPVRQISASSAAAAAPVKPKSDPKQELANINAPSKPAGAHHRDERLPPLNLLSSEQSNQVDEAHIHDTAQLLERTLSEFGIPARVVGFRVGPTVTQFAVEPGFIEKTGPDGEITRSKIRVSQISALSRDLALRLSAERLRIEAPVPGRSFVGVEVPNPRKAVVRLRPILDSDAFLKITSTLAIALGQDVSGQPVVVDLARMPHMLIAGTTGSGKSVCIEALTTCLVMNNTPDELRLAMMDPKMVELVRFNGLPHLLGKVETEIDRMLGVLRWALAEMDHRYRLLEEARVRDLDSYNRKLERKKQQPLPRIVVLIDELADLMMSAPDQTEQCVVRLAQMARATGIHLVVATQRPSTDVVTGLIKANFPARIAFTVASSIDSRVILDSSGAETLLGRGDLLFLNPEQGTPVRSQGVFVNDQEIEKVIAYWQKMRPPDPAAAAPWEELLQNDDDDTDKLVEEAVKIVRSSQRASASMLQRRLRIGYPRAANLIEQLEALGVVGPSQGGGREREVLLPPEDGEDDETDGLEEG
jgi:DNA segregation ATPase FtsK/SpoIIIE, S-DNA-T family